MHGALHFECGASRGFCETADIRVSGAHIVSAIIGIYACRANVRNSSLCLSFTTVQISSPSSTIFFYGFRGLAILVKCNKTGTVFAVGITIND